MLDGDKQDAVAKLSDLPGIGDDCLVVLSAVVHVSGDACICCLSKKRIQHAAHGRYGKDGAVGLLQRCAEKHQGNGLPAAHGAHDEEVLGLCEGSACNLLLEPGAKSSCLVTVEPPH